MTPCVGLVDWQTGLQSLVFEYLVVGVRYLIFGILHLVLGIWYLSQKNDAGVGLVDWQTGLQSMVGADWLLLASLSC